MKLLANAINKNRPNDPFVAAAVPKLTWDLRLFDSYVSRCLRKHGYQRSPLLCGSITIGMCKKLESSLIGSLVGVK